MIRLAKVGVIAALAAFALIVAYDNPRRCSPD